MGEINSMLAHERVQMEWVRLGDTNHGHVAYEAPASHS